MLKVDDISISFGHKEILCKTEFMAYRNTLHIIKGKSGIGKSTFLDALLFKFPCQYEYDEKIINDLSADEKQRFIYTAISMVYQTPIFIDELTIKEHISFLKKLYVLESDKVKYFEKLGIRSMLDKYPSQLSGGERTRANIYLGLLKEPEIFILDEPTAALDKENKEKVIELLKEYAHTGHMVIIASHDNYLIKEADILYAIQDKKLVMEKKRETKEIKGTVINKVNKVKIRGFYDYWIRMNNRYKIYNIVMTMVLAISLILTIYGYHFFSISNQGYQDNLNDLGSKEIIVYKPLHPDDYYDFDGRHFPFTDKEVESLNTLKHVDKITWRYDNWSGDGDFFMGDDYDYNQSSETDKQMRTVALEDGDTIIHYTAEEGFDIYVHSFDEEIDYSSKLQYQYQQTGIYISKQMFREIFKEQPEKLKRPYLSFNLGIPQYNATGYSWAVTSKDEYIPSNKITGRLLKVRLPIAGVLESNALSHEDELSANHLYIGMKVLQSYIQESLPTEARNIYYINTLQQRYINTLPEGVEATIEANDQIITEVPYRPTAYSVIVDNVQNVNTVIKDIKKMGLNVESRYVNSQYLMNMDINNQQLLIATGILILIVLYIFYLYLKYLQLTNNQSLVQFLKNQGLTKKEISKVYQQRWLYNGIRLAICSSILLWIALEGLSRAYYIIVRPSWMMYGYIILVAFIIEVLFPMLMKRWYYHD